MLKSLGFMVFRVAASRGVVFHWLLSCVWLLRFPEPPRAP